MNKETLTLTESVKAGTNTEMEDTKQREATLQEKVDALDAKLDADDSDYGSEQMTALWNESDKLDAQLENVKQEVKVLEVGQNFLPMIFVVAFQQCVLEYLYKLGMDDGKVKEIQYYNPPAVGIRQLTVKLYSGASYEAFFDVSKSEPVVTIRNKQTKHKQLLQFDALRFFVDLDKVEAEQAAKDAADRREEA